MKMKRSSSPTNYLINKFKSLRSNIKRMLRNAGIEYINEICANRDFSSKRLWSSLRRNLKFPTFQVKCLPESVRHSVNMFNEYFVSIFSSSSSDSGVVYEFSDHEHNIEFENITILEKEVLAVIMNLNNHIAHGSDNITARLLKETAVQIAPSLCSLFKNSLRIGVVPDE